MARKAKPRKGKLTYGPCVWNHGYLRSLCVWLGHSQAFLPQGTLAVLCKTLFTLTASYPIYYHPVPVSAGPVASVSVPAHRVDDEPHCSIPESAEGASGQMAFLLIMSKGCAILFSFFP